MGCVRAKEGMCVKRHPDAPQRQQQQGVWSSLGSTMSRASSVETAQVLQKLKISTSNLFWPIYARTVAAFVCGFDSLASWCDARV